MFSSRFHTLFQELSHGWKEWTFFGPIVAAFVLYRLIPRIRYGKWVYTHHKHVCFREGRPETKYEAKYDADGKYWVKADST